MDPRPAHRPCTLFLDANVLLDHPELSRWRTDRSNLTVVVLARVAQEIHGLGRRADATAAQARRASLALEALRQRGPRAPLNPGCPRVQLRRGDDLSADVDGHLVAEARAYQDRHPEQAVGVVTRDHGVWDRAGHGVYCVLVRGTFDNAALARAVRETLAGCAR